MSTQKFERPRTALIYIFFLLEACRDGCSVTTAAYSVQGIVGMGLSVITSLVSVTEGVRLDGKDLFVIKVTIVHNTLLLRLNIIVSIKSINKLLQDYILFLQTLI